jgi:hypothetical protein
MLQVSVNRRHLMVFVAVIAMFVSVAWVGTVSRASAASSTPVVYVATGENFPDALGAGPAAATVAGPILLVTQNGIPSETAAELTRLAPDKIIIVGGTAVVSSSVESGLGAYAGSVERIAGANRYETAAKLSAATFPVTSSVGGGDADTLDGQDSTAFLTKAAYDKNDNGVIDSAEIKIRYADQTFGVDMATGFPGRAKCKTPPVTFNGGATVVASGSLSLDPIGTSAESIYGYVYYSMDDGATWTTLDGVAVHDSPPAGQLAAAVPINAAGELQVTDTYVFAIMAYGTNHQTAPNADDYTGYCELTVTIYSGQGASTDFFEK